jgi:GT2 family glycosyltransferase
MRNSPSLGNLIVVNDGSGEETTGYLKRFHRDHERCVLIENGIPRRYTRAANQGLKQSNAGIVVLLNSDTVVAPRWLEKMRRALAFDEGFGVVGPLSNAAGYQSVPRRGDGFGDWAVNELPKGWSVERMDRIVEACSAPGVAEVTFLNGFCLMIDRRVIDSIGLFDEDAFPEGFGEEDDFCIRARDAGIRLAVVTDTYVYHAKSRSYSRDQRKELSRLGRQTLKQKHGEDRVERDALRMRRDPVLAEMRRLVHEVVVRVGAVDTVGSGD